MRVSSVILPLAGTLLVEASSSSPGCSALKGSVNSSIFYPNTDVYEYEAQNFWSNTEIMSPGCVFRPQSSAQLGEGVKALVDAQAKFAVRGGGHMGIRVRRNLSRINRVVLIHSRDRTISTTVCSL